MDDIENELLSWIGGDRPRRIHISLKTANKLLSINHPIGKGYWVCSAFGGASNSWVMHSSPNTDLSRLCLETDITELNMSEWEIDSDNTLQERGLKK